MKSYPNSVENIRLVFLRIMNSGPEIVEIMPIVVVFPNGGQGRKRPESPIASQGDAELNICYYYSMFNLFFICYLPFFFFKLLLFFKINDKIKKFNSQVSKFYSWGLVGVSERRHQVYRNSERLAGRYGKIKCTTCRANNE